MKPASFLLFFSLCALPVRATDYFVATNGSDAASGKAAQSFRTLQKGIDSASQPGDTVTVLPGTYSEELLLRSSGAPNKPIVIKAARKQEVILDGAERVRDWRLVDQAQNLWTRAFGTSSPYNNDHGRWDMAPRSEQIFVDGKRCVQNKEVPIADYSFTATLANPAIYVLKLPQGMTPDTATTEITVKSSLLKVRADHVVIDGFVFRRVRNTYQNAMVTLNGEGIEFRDNLLEYSSAGSGLGIQTKHSHIHDNIFRSNGQFGFATGGSDNLIENNLVQGNDLAGYKEWGTGGTKIVGNGNTIRRNRFIGNLGGVAIWLDDGPCNNVIEYNYVSGNYGEGIRAEISFHSYIGFNLVEGTRPCTSTMFGRTQTHCIGISVQNSAETCVVHNFLKDNLGVGLQLSTYMREAANLSKWQVNYADAPHQKWLRQSWDGKLVYAYSNLFFNNVVVQNTTGETNACVFLMGLLNGQRPHCFGNQFDYNFYWNPVTHAPKIHVKKSFEVPNGRSEWQTLYGMDTHALGGFSPEDYAHPAFGDEPPYQPTVYFAGTGRGKDLTALLPWRRDIDYLGKPAANPRKPSMGHIQ